MKLCTFAHESGARIGVVTDERVVDLVLAAPELPRETRALLAARPRNCAASGGADSRGSRAPPGEHRPWNRPLAETPGRALLQQ